MKTLVEKRVWLSPEQAQRLRELAKQHQTSEEQIINQAFDVFLRSLFSPDAFVQHPENAVHSSFDIDEHASVQMLSENAFRDYLQSSGILVANAPSAIIQQDRTPIVIKGKSLSETILEDRR